MIIEQDQGHRYAWGKMPSTQMRQRRCVKVGVGVAQAFLKVLGGVIARAVVFRPKQSPRSGRGIASG